MDWFQATYRLCCIFSALKHGKLLEDETENNKLGIRHTANEIVTVQPREFPLCEPWQQPSECPVGAPRPPNIWESAGSPITPPHGTTSNHGKQTANPEIDLPSNEMVTVQPR